MPDSSQEQPRPQQHHQQRLPAPSLFVGPPSRNASSAELRPPPGLIFSSTRLPLLSQRTVRDEQISTYSKHAGTSSTSQKAYDVESSAARSSGPIASAAQAMTDHLKKQNRKSPQQERRRRGSTIDRTEAVWSEMQSTLEEVELNAMSGKNVFGPDHSRALEELRNAQIALAQAWVRSEADDAEENIANDDEGEALGRGGAGLGDGVDRMEGSGVLARDRKERLGSKGERGGVGGEAGKGGKNEKTRLEEETENDILLARKRRQANDRYFERVNQGVVDVVAKLDVVASRMRGVEMESEEIWGDKDSVDGPTG